MVLKIFKNPLPPTKDWEQTNTPIVGERYEFKTIKLLESWPRDKRRFRKTKVESLLFQKRPFLEGVLEKIEQKEFIFKGRKIGCPNKKNSYFFKISKGE